MQLDALISCIVTVSCIQETIFFPRLREIGDRVLKTSKNMKYLHETHEGSIEVGAQCEERIGRTTEIRIEISACESPGLFSH